MSEAVDDERVTSCDLASLRAIIPRLGCIHREMTEDIVIRGDCFDLLHYCPREHAYSDDMQWSVKYSLSRNPSVTEDVIARAFAKWLGGEDKLPKWFIRA